MSRAAACATSPGAQKAADRALADGGSAADAVVAGFFALAGELPGALFAPTTALIAGPGVAGRALDGRACQPGHGVKRPRGIVDDATVPTAARAAVPRSAHAVLLLQGTHARRALKKNVASGVAIAKSAGAEKRAAYLAKIGDGGSVGLASANEAILRTAGVYSSGLITEEDLGEARPDDVPAIVLEERASTGEAMRVHLEPWTPSAPDGPSAIVAPSIAAVDARGLLVALVCFALPAEGDVLVVPEIEVALPLLAEPVRRGRTRVAPGTVFAVPRALAAVDCGPSLRFAMVLPAGFADDRASAAFAVRPVEDGLRALAEASPLWGVVATGREARPVAFRESA